RYCVVGCYFGNPVYIPDVQIFPTSLKEVTFLENYIRSQSPDILINATGLTDREKVKEQQKLADALNIVLPVSLATLATKVKAKFYQLS
ncbi:hypothetical protein, partial [Pseudomonas sp. FW305-122]|uniref:hypothetical protein n=1 Tax=Pseudomonas sp. FW305-122 TaxID=2070561 RepID=UPI001C493109